MAQSSSTSRRHLVQLLQWVATAWYLEGALFALSTHRTVREVVAVEGEMEAVGDVAELEVVLRGV